MTDRKKFYANRTGFSIQAIIVALLCLGATTSAFAHPPQHPSYLPRWTPEGMLFQCHAPGATRVFLAGSFNHWAQNRGGIIRDNAYAMEGPDEHGVFRKVVRLEPGIHRYKFAIDQSPPLWFIPEYTLHRDDDGNALLVVDPSADSPHQPRHARAPHGASGEVRFELFAPRAAIVFLAGEFNQWANNRGGVVHDLRFAMRGPDQHGIWSATVPLPPGRHRYQFVLEGREWITNPHDLDNREGEHSVVEVAR